MPILASRTSLLFDVNISVILAKDIEEDLLPLVLNLTDRKYDVMLLDSRGVPHQSYIH